MIQLIIMTLYGYVEGKSICSFKGVWSRSFLMQKGIIRKEESHKQAHIETQTWWTNKGGSKKNQTWSLTLIDNCMWNMGMFISLRLSDEGPCPMGYWGKGGSHKLNMHWDRNLTDKHSRDKDKKQTWSATLIDGQSRNCRQSRTLQLAREQPGGCRMLEMGSVALCQGRASVQGEEQRGEQTDGV